MKPILSLITIFCCILFSACGSNDGPNEEKKTTHRTVLVYMVADNTLGNWSCDDDDLAEMLEAAQADKLNGGRLLVYHNRPGTERGNAPRLLEMTKDGIITLKDYADDPTIYSVDPARIKEVLSDMKKFSPADDYGLVLWSHADGWLEHDGDFGTRSFGEDRKKHISLPGLAKALDGNYFSFIYFDCCLMGNVETAYELRRLTPVIVASPTELYINGMPYQNNVECFFTTGKPDMLRAAKNTYESYANASYAPYCQMVVINTEGLDALASASHDIFAAMTDYPADISGIQKYSINSKCWSFDMKQYMELMAGGSQLYKTWESAFNATVSAAHSTPVGIGNLEIHTYNGLGSFIILSESDITYRGYNNCAWYNDVVSAQKFN